MTEERYGTGIVSCPKCDSVRVKGCGGKRRECRTCGHEWTAKKSVLPPFVKDKVGERSEV